MNTSNNWLSVRIPLHRHHLLQSLSTSARQLFRNRIRKGEQHHVLNYIQLTNLSGGNLFLRRKLQPISSCVAAASKDSNGLRQLKTMPVALRMSMRNDGLGLSEKVKDGALQEMVLRAG
jgi:hypothetical protein